MTDCEHGYEDVGECYEGCCDKYQCTKCGKRITVEVAQ